MVRRGMEWHQLLFRPTGELEPAQFQGGIRELHPDSARLLDTLIDGASILSDGLRSNGFNLVNPTETVWRAIKQRRGQPQFRASLMAAYGGRCAITGCDAETALEAAHIDEYSATGSQNLANGLLLRADIHTLFDLYLIQIKPKSLVVVLTAQLKATCYSQLQGTKLRMPTNPAHKPDARALQRRWERALARGQK